MNQLISNAQQPPAGPSAASPPAEALASAMDLSAAARQFLDFAAAHPLGLAPIDYRTASYPDWLRVQAGEYYRLQSWPTFVDARKSAELRRATVGVTRLLKSIPERIFDGDPVRIAKYYRLSSELMATLLLAPPNGIDTAVARCDLIDSVAGVKCIEVNAGRLGGWQLRYFEEACRKHPLVASFIAERGLHPVHVDPLEVLLRHVVEDNVARPHCADGAVNCAVVTSPDLAAALSFDELNGMYESLLRRAGAAAGHLIVAHFGQLAVRGGIVYLGAMPLHALIEMSSEDRPQAIYRSFKAEQLTLYNGPVELILNDKRNLALLSQHAAGDRFTPEERAIIEAHVPWCRDLADSQVTYRGETRNLSQLLREERCSFVIKPIAGFQGRDVFVGPAMTPEAWRAVVDRLAGQPGYLAQEHVASRPHLYQYGDHGTAVHDLVWGLFAFGESYGGGFIRMMPRHDSTGVINSARGATEGILFEV